MHCRTGVALCQPGHFARIDGQTLGRSGSSQGIVGWPGISTRPLGRVYLGQPLHRHVPRPYPTHRRDHAHVHVLLELDFSHKRVQSAGWVVLNARSSAPVLPGTIQSHKRLAIQMKCPDLVGDTSPTQESRAAGNWYRGKAVAESYRCWVLRQWYSFLRLRTPMTVGKSGSATARTRSLRTSIVTSHLDAALPCKVSQFLRIVQVTVGDGHDALDRVALNPHLGRLKKLRQMTGRPAGGAAWMCGRNTRRMTFSRHPACVRSSNCSRCRAIGRRGSSC